MARDIALLANVQSRVNAILGANPGVWSAAVSGQVGAFPDIAEITQAALEADGEVITRGYFNSVNDTLCQPFITFSSPLPNGANVPLHYGNSGKIQLASRKIAFATTDVDATADTFSTASKSPAAHNLVTGSEVSLSVGSGTLPGGLTANTSYFCRFVDTVTFKLSTTIENAFNGVTIDLTNQGSVGYTMLIWEPGLEVDKITVANINASGKDYVQAQAVAAMLPTNPMGCFYCIENGNLYHTSTHARIEYPDYTRTTSLQANKVDETLITAGTVRNLTKDASPAAFQEWTNMWAAGLQAIIQDGSYNPPGDQNP